MNSRKNYFLYFGLVSMSCYFLGCSHTSDSALKRGIASNDDAAYSQSLDAARAQILASEAKVDGGHVHFPEGLTPQEKYDLWHMGEGSEVFPLKWFLNLKSLTTKNPGQTYLMENLGEKFGVIKEPDQIAKHHWYPLKFIGLATAWSNVDSKERDVQLDPQRPISDVSEVREIGGKKSIAMTGVNCSFCHTTDIKIEGKNHLIDGAPNMLNIRGFFEDEFGSLAQTMLTKKYLKEYLERIDYKGGDADKTAEEFSNSFRQALHLLPKDFSTIVGLPENKISYDIETFAKDALSNIEDITYRPAKVEDKKVAFIKKMFFEHRQETEEYLIRFMKMTYSLDDKDISKELHLRMHWLAEAIGQDPSIKSMNDGYARTDAFGRIANLVARFKQPIALTGSASLPPMWNIQYRAMFHWNANTNSVVMRNLGQAFGLGAILLNPGQNGAPTTDYDSTAHLTNILKLESLLYKVQIPQLATEYDIPVFKEKFLPGCDLYRQKCLHCHGAAFERVGPTKELISYNISDVELVKTDDQYLKNQSTPVDGVPFKTALFNFTGAVKENFYKKNHVSETEQASEEHRALRGVERFRDTYLSEHSFYGEESYLDTNEKAGNHPGYIARPLAGAWATAPYLHNGSVPTMYDLLTPEKQRPKIFFTGSREYDLDKLGYKSGIDSLPPEAQGLSLKKACAKYPTRCLDTTVAGHVNSNYGHSGGDFTVDTDLQRAQLIEFLKVLRPEPEYSRHLPLLYTVNPAGKCVSVTE